MSVVPYSVWKESARGQAEITGRPAEEVAQFLLSLRRSLYEDGLNSFIGLAMTNGDEGEGIPLSFSDLNDLRKR